MPKRMTSVILVILVISHAATLLMVRSTFAQHVADNCISKPDSVPPQGSHWYYRMDRTLHRQCWYLGPQGAKVEASPRPAALSVRLPSPRPISRPTDEALLESTDPRATTEIVAGANGVAANVALRLTDRLSALGSPSQSQAEEQIPRNGQDDNPLIWPVLTVADLRAVQPQRDYTVESARMLAIFAGALAFAAVMVRSFYKRPAAAPSVRSNVLGQTSSAAEAHRQRDRALPAFTGGPAVGRQPELIPKSIGTGRQRDIACSLSQPGDGGRPIEKMLFRRQVAGGVF
jgi:hypothetical protein